jgi:hypothetical protein
LGKKKHFVTNIDTAELMGDCAHCGRVHVRLKRGKYWTCRKAAKTYASYWVKRKQKTNQATNLAIRIRGKKKCVEYAGGSCRFCGYARCLRALHFHHVDPKEKEFTVSRTYKSWEKMRQEIDKCILVCSNCHAEIHEGLITQDEVEKILRTVA